MSDKYQTALDIALAVLRSNECITTVERRNGELVVAYTFNSVDYISDTLTRVKSSVLGFYPEFEDEDHDYSVNVFANDGLWEWPTND